jgi:transcriptional regulator with XRE-family HTH domain
MAKDVPNKESVLVSLRLEAGLTQKQLATALEVTEQTVRNWEQGKVEARFTLLQIKQLCLLLGKSLDELPDGFSTK